MTRGFGFPADGAPRRFISCELLNAPAGTTGCLGLSPPTPGAR